MDDRAQTDEDLRRQLQALRERLATLERADADRRRAEEALRRSEERLRLALQAARLGTFEWDLGADRITWDEGQERLYGLPPGAFRGTFAAFLDRVHPEDRDRVRREVGRALEGGTADDLEFRIVWPDGSVRWIARKGRVVRDGRGRAVRMVGVSLDVTERRESEERHRLLTELTSDYTWTSPVAPDGTAGMGTVTAGFVRVTGYTQEEVAARGGWASVVHPEDWARLPERNRRLLDGEGLVDEMRLLTKDGQTRWVRYSAYPIRDPVQGRVTRLVGAAQDITERRQVEEDLRETNQALQSLIRASPLGIVALDRDGHVLVWNQAAERIFGWRAEEVEGRPLPIIPADRGDEFRAFREAELRGEGRVASEIQRLRKDGTLVDVSIWTAPLRDAQGVVGRTIGIVADITDRKRAEAQLREQSERLRELSHRLLEVQEQERRHLARELHDEVGQQLTGLQFALGLCGSVPGEEVRAHLVKAQAMVRDLIACVREISLGLRPSMLDDLGLLPALLWHFERYTAQTRVRVRFEHHGLERRLSSPEVETAAYRIVQEALNNVARHAGVGEVAVRISLDRGTLRLHIEDRGAGFDPEAVLASGAGCGLSGMRQRAALLGSRLAITSAPGAGTRLSAEWPADGSGVRHDESDAGAGR